MKIFVSSFKKREVVMGYMDSPETLSSSFSSFSLFPSQSHKVEPGYGAHGWMGLSKSGDDARGCKVKARLAKSSILYRFFQLR